MLVTRLSPVALALVAASAVACSPRERTPAESVGESESPIINGTPDTGNDSVVFIQFGNSGACTGTIVAKNGSTGYALTAAHCFGAGNPQVVVQADNLNNPQGVFNVTGSATHPSYNANNSTYDFGVVRFTGAGANTPVTPMPTPAMDNVGSGDTVEVSGYGLTENGNTSDARLKANVTLSGCAQLGLGNGADSLFLCYLQQNGGPCSGDSGGPAFATIGGTKYVVGVTSFGDQNCTQFGVSGRASEAKSFVDGFISGAPVELTCDQCIQAATTGQGACMSAVNACFDNNDCAGLVDCLNGCNNNQTCIDNCAADFQAGIDEYLAIFDCACQDACATECAGDPSCPTPPACGFSADAACQQCFESACCAEATACADDPVCGSCFSNNPDPGCATSALADAFGACLEQSCADACGIMGGGGGGGAGGSGGAGGGGPGGSGGAGGGGPGGSGGTGGSGANDGTGAGNGGTESSGDCGCRVVGAGSGRPDERAGALAGLALALVAFRRRRR